jgi:hypothetical protein
VGPAVAVATSGGVPVTDGAAEVAGAVDTEVAGAVDAEVAGAVDVEADGDTDDEGDTDGEGVDEIAGNIAGEVLNELVGVCGDCCTWLAPLPVTGPTAGVWSLDPLPVEKFPVEMFPVCGVSARTGPVAGGAVVAVRAAGPVAAVGSAFACPAASAAGDAGSVRRLSGAAAGEGCCGVAESSVAGAAEVPPSTTSPGSAVPPRAMASRGPLGAGDVA